jgi:DNA-binding NarL/FixJ family response regulator
MSLTPCTPIRVIIVDDFDIVRRGLITVLADTHDIDVIAEAQDGEIAVSLCQKLCPDVVVMDMKMPRMNGIEATRLIRQSCPQTQIIALTSYDDEDDIQAILKAGAISFLMKNVTVDELVSAIHRTHAGQAILAPEAARVLIHLNSQIGIPEAWRTITAHEQKILTLMMEGMTNQQIATHFTISQATVKNHVANILAKLGTISRTQAVVLAIKLKIIE